jgi:hypothetical protein
MGLISSIGSDTGHHSRKEIASPSHRPCQERYLEATEQKYQLSKLPKLSSYTDGELGTKGWVKLRTGEDVSKTGNRKPRLRRLEGSSPPVVKHCGEMENAAARNARPTQTERSYAMRPLTLRRNHRLAINYFARPP